VISALVPTRGGDLRLERNLPSVRRSLAQSGDDWELLVADDGGELRGTPHDAKLVRLEPAGGYGPAVNAAAAAAKGDLLLVLNDDVRLEDDTVRVLQAALPEAGVFAVAPRIVSPLARCGDEGGKTAAFAAGLLEIGEAPAEKAHATFYPVGCCYLCPRRTFLELGGYDDVYAPYFWEDVDLGYRAWRRGLASLHVPRAVCHHEGSATIGARSMRERRKAWHRNWALFHLRNLQDVRLRAESFGAWAAYALFDEDPDVAAGIAEALERFARVGRRPADGLSDAEIVARSRPR
jgi:GT2 family glycosyltransferase